MSAVEPEIGNAFSLAVLRRQLQPSWLEHDVQLLIYARIAMSAMRSLAGVIVPLYLVQVGFNGARLGELVAVVAITSALMSTSVGLLADRLGRKFFVVLIPLFSALAAVIFSFAQTDWLLFAMAALGSFGRGGGAGAGMVGPYQPAEQALVADAIPGRYRNSIFGRLAFASSLGAVVGAPLAALPQLAGLFGLHGADAYRPAFFLASFLALVASLLVLPVRDRRPPVRVSAPKALFRFPRRSWPLLFKLWATNSVNGLAIGFFGPFITYWFYRRYGVSAAEIGLLYFLINLGSMASNLGAASIAGRLGLVRTIVFTRIISALLIVAMVTAPIFWLAGAVYFVRMLANRISMPLRQSYVMAMAEPDERAGVAALSGLPAQAASSITPLLGGYLLDNVSLALPFELASILQCTNGVLYYLFFRHLRPPEEVEAAAQLAQSSPEAS